MNVFSSPNKLKDKKVIEKALRVLPAETRLTVYRRPRVLTSPARSVLWISASDFRRARYDCLESVSFVCCVCLLIRSFTGLFVPSFAGSFVRLFVRWVSHSPFNRSFLYRLFGFRLYFCSFFVENCFEMSGIWTEQVSFPFLLGHLLPFVLEIWGVPLFSFVVCAWVGACVQACVLASV